MDVEQEDAEDRTCYWTLSFYIPIETLDPKWRAEGHAFNRQAEHIKVLGKGELTSRLRRAVEPLFNDVADRSRLGEIEDLLFAANPAEDVVFLMSADVQWMTEGRDYIVPIPHAHRQRAAKIRRFWYVHGNGTVSWHVSFSVRYGTDLARDLAEGVPSTFYFLSLLQKLAWPKEFRGETGPQGVDDVIGMRMRGADGEQRGFWAFIEHCFQCDAGLLAELHPEGETDRRFAKLVRTVNSLEVPDLKYSDNRSMFFIHDSHFFALMQPTTPEGELVSRRRRVSQAAFGRYPGLVRERSVQDGPVRLVSDYWAEVFAEMGADDADHPSAVDRLTYLFLAGFNQNIIDFTNQDASEVLDSLDPIYPRSDEQKEEGFFLRYANPRAMITYVPRSRTLEVGNDYIGTCPYAFLIHALTLHNEMLTRAQELATHAAIEAVTKAIDAGVRHKGHDHHHFERAEELVNATRLDAFQNFERNRYMNPFRYDTERDVFDDLAALRGTSRLKAAYEGALASLEEQIRDLDRIRAAGAADKDDARNRRLSLLLGLLGLSGVIQVAFNCDTYYRFLTDTDRQGVMTHMTDANIWLGIGYVVVPCLLAAMFYRHFWR